MYPNFIRPICLLALLSLLFATTPSTIIAQDAPSFRLSFDAPEQVFGQPGDLVEFPVKVLLTTKTGQSEGPSGWSIGAHMVGIGAPPEPKFDGEELDTFVQFTTAGTAAAETRFGGRREGGFENTELATDGEKSGVVSAVALALLPGADGQPVTLPDGTWAILNLVAQARVPTLDDAREGSCGTAVLGFSSTLKGSGEEVPLVVSFQNVSYDPEISQTTVEVCPSPCFKSELVPGWASNLYESSVPFVHASRRLSGIDGESKDHVYELCSVSTGYADTSDSIHRLSRMTSRRFDFSAELLGLEGPGSTGLEVRAFEASQVATDVYFGVRWTDEGIDQTGAVTPGIVASFRSSREGEAKVLQLIPIEFIDPMGGHHLRIQGDGSTLIASFSRDGGKTFETLAEIPAEGKLASPFLRAAMVQSSDGKNPSVAKFRNPRISNPTPSGRPRVPIASLAPLSGDPGEVTSLTIPGRNFGDVTEVLVAGTPAEIVEIGANGIECKVPPTTNGQPTRGDIVLRGDFGELLIPDAYFAYPTRKFIRCNCNDDDKHDISDALALLGTLFLGTAPCECKLSGDCNGDGIDDITDAIYSLRYLFVGGIEPPQAPYPNPGGNCGIEGGPEITALSQTTINEGDIFTVTGSGFLEEPAANAVIAGDAQMTVLKATPNELTVRVDKILREEITEVIIVTDFDDIVKRFQLVICSPDDCPLLLIGPFVISEEVITLIPPNTGDAEQLTFLGTSELTTDGAIEILLDPEKFDPTQEIEVVATLLVNPLEGLSQGARTTRFRHTFSSPTLSFDQGVHELGQNIGAKLGGGKPLHGFGIRTVAEKASIRLEPTLELKSALDRDLLALDGFISFYGPPIGLCGPEEYHPIEDERPFCWCRFEELVEPCGGLPGFEWFIPKEFVLAESESLASLPHPNERLPEDKEIMYNLAAYCHVRDHNLWNKCEQEELVEAAGVGEGDLVDIPPFPRDAWVLKTNWVSEEEMPQAMLDLVPDGSSAEDVFYSYVYDGPGEENGTRYYLVLLHHTTKDINDWVWYDIYLPGDTSTQEPDPDGGKMIGGCGGRNDDIPASLAGSIWNSYFLCTDVEHEQPLAEESVPEFKAGWCGNAWIDTECPDIFDEQGGGDTCMNCHDGSTEGLVMAGPTVDFGASGKLNMDFLFSLTHTISVPDPCEEPPEVIDFTTDVQPILSGCSCHQGAGGSAGLDLSPGMAYGELVGEASTQVPGMDRITPMDTANSYLWHKINDTQGTVGGAGSQMPLGGPPFLGMGDLNIIEQWILDGANP